MNAPEKLLACVAVFLLTACGNGTCPNVDNDNHELAWDYYSHSEAAREWIAAYYGISENDWDEGWGWNQDNPAYEFPKMWNATILLSQINTSLRGRWNSKLIMHPDFPSTTFPDLAEFGNPGGPVMLLDGTQADVFIRNSSGELLHYSYDYLDRSPDSHKAINITNERDNTNSDDVTFQDNLHVIDRPNGQFTVIGYNGGGNPKVVRYSSSGSPGNIRWQADDVTPAGASLHIVNPHVFNVGHDAFYMVGANPSGDLLTYYASTLAGSGFGATLSPFTSAEWSISRAPNSVIAYQHDGNLEVFAVRAFDGHVLHFSKNANNEWTAEDITEPAGDLYALSPDSALILKAREDDYYLLGRQQDGEVVAYLSALIECGIFGSVFDDEDCEPGRISFTRNISQDAELLHNASGSTTWSIDTRIHTGPVAAQSRTGPLLRFHIAGLGYGLYTQQPQFVKLYRLADARWYQLDLTVETAQGAVDTINDILALSDPQLIETGDEVRVYSINSDKYIQELKCSFVDNTCSHNIPAENTASRGVELLGFLPVGTAIDGYGAPHLAAVWKNGSWLQHYHFISDRAWHSSLDYETISSGYEHGFHYEPKNETPDDDASAKAFWGLFTSDRVEVYCPSFNIGPSGLAGIIVHEGAHMATHITHEDVEVNGENIKKDFYHLHTLGAISYDNLDSHLSDYPHPAYQTEAEYLADLSQYSYAPLQIRRSAETRANSRLRSRFVNEPGWKVGIPRPL